MGGWSNNGGERGETARVKNLGDMEEEGGKKGVVGMWEKQEGGEPRERERER